MSRKNYPSFYAPDEIEAYAEELETIARTDLFVLKAQILLEHRMRHFLAFRMEADAGAVMKATERTPFAALIELALCESDLAWMRKELLMLNDVRVSIAHRLTHSGHEKALEKWVRAKGIRGSTTDTKVLSQAVARTLHELELLEDDIRDGQFGTSESRLAEHVKAKGTRSSRAV